MTRTRVVALLVFATALLAIPAMLLAAMGPVTFNLSAQNGSGETGTAILTDLGNGQTRVDLTIQGQPDVITQPVHIHNGNCPIPGSVAFSLSPALSGKSVTTVTASLDSITNGKFSINGHRSVTQMDQANYVFCGDIPALSAIAQVTGTATTTATTSATTTATTAVTAAATVTATTTTTSTVAATRTVTATAATTSTAAATTAPTTSATTAAPTATAAATATSSAPSTIPTTGGLPNDSLLYAIVLGALVFGAGFFLRRMAR